VKLRQYPSDWEITYEEFGEIVGISRETVCQIITGQRYRGIGLPFVIAWVRLYGSRLPFRELQASIRCAHCGHKV
jgi:hypothetical protein